ncbi:Methyl-accepting chemotaxis protein (MCP) signaling domain-containing protein [Dioscorea alata]|uniref:Methyl-accepting chemotaxis protein (MCP) signaling domain-containing protein n=1 Tax=Dioscorea alata TaxID=55571 RepID=A0ACB7VYG2_DIOAL|nr:Methyl-accepting chemotaxis protein (MCP) signaling domain-containing protein [Dioscorea alata]
MKSSVDLNDQESSNKDSKNIDSKLQIIPSSGNARFSLPNIPVWWALGALVCLALPFYKRILRIEDGLKKTVETVVEAIETIAEETEKVTEEIVDALPEGMLKQAVMEVEDIARQVDDGAEKIEEFLEKADKIEDKVEDLVEPIIEEAKNKEGDSQVQNEASPNTDLAKATSEPNDKKCI